MTDTKVTDAPFQRDERYIVVKRKRLTSKTESVLRSLLDDYNVDTVECVVVESDWPEYEQVWAMIEARCTGNPLPSITDLQSQLSQSKAEIERLIEKQNALFAQIRPVMVLVSRHFPEGQADADNIICAIDTLTTESQDA